LLLAIEITPNHSILNLFPFNFLSIFFVYR
jgi:hypothetical protein